MKSLQERLEQCRKDKAAIEANEQEILAEIEEETKKKEGFRVWELLVKPYKEDYYVFALVKPMNSREYNIPDDFEGRGAFSKKNILDIIEGLQNLIKE